MNNKMAKILHLNVKNKLSKPECHRQNRGYAEHFDGCQIGEQQGG